MVGWHRVLLVGALAVHLWGKACADDGEEAAAAGTGEQRREPVHHLLSKLERNPLCSLVSPVMSLCNFY